MTTKHSPSHPDIIKVDLQTGPGFRSVAKAAQAFDVGQLLTKLNGITHTQNNAYTVVQCGPDKYFNLNSDFVYMNHSCEPNVELDLSSPNESDWHIRAVRTIALGDDITYFYPSTEWAMDQPFQCSCEAQTCLQSVNGAISLPAEELQKRGFINPFIWDLVNKRDAEK